MAFGLLALLCISHPVFAQVVEILLKDGTSVKGELLNYENREYHVRVDGAERKIEEGQVLQVSLLGAGAIVQQTVSVEPPANAAAALDQIRKLFEQGNVEQAAQLTVTYMHDFAVQFQKMQDEVHQLILDVHTEYLNRLIQARSANHIASELLAVLSILPDSDAQALYDMAFEGLKKVAKEEHSPSVMEWTLVMAELCQRQPLLKDRHTDMAEFISDMSFQLLQAGESAWVIRLLERAPVLDEKIFAKTKDLLFQALMASAMQAQKEGHLDKALTDVTAALIFDPQNETALNLQQDVLYAQLQSDLSAMPDPYQQKDRIEETLPRLTRPDYKSQMEKKLSEIKAASGAVVGDSFQGLKKYFPLQEGMWHRYQSQDGNTTEKIRLDTVVPDEGLLRVYMTHEKTYRSYVTSQTLQLEIDHNHVYKNSRADVLLQLPIQVGESWQWKDGSGTFQRTYKSNTETVVTKAGTFENCLVVEFTSTAVFSDQQSLTITSLSYYAPRVGLVKLELLPQEYNQKYSMELIEYGIEKP